MFQDHSKIPDASAIDQFKKFSLISILMSLFGLVIFYPTGLIGIVCMIRTVLLAKHEATKKIKNRTLYLVIAGIGALVGVLDIILLVTT